MASDVQLCVTCLVDLFRPQAGQAALRVLERHGARVRFPADQTCCGQFSYNAGYRREAAALARHFIEVFERAPEPVVMLSGSCAAMVIHEYPDLVAEDAAERGESVDTWRTRAEAIGRRVVEFSQWLKTHPHPDPEAADPRAAVVHHVGCHMRRLLKDTRSSRDALMAAHITPKEPDTADDCCGFGGTSSITEPVVAAALADAKWASFEPFLAAGASGVTGADLGCLFHLAGRRDFLGRPAPVWYLAEVVDAAETGQWPPAGGDA
ncbi:MAG: (Fe-S)-binding protein [Sulfobacillus sp.]|nr:(Fe-S)-binding protein [Sulfobacillus sp.]